MSAINADNTSFNDTVCVCVIESVYAASAAIDFFYQSVFGFLSFSGI